MTEKQLRFAIFGNVYQAKKSASIQKIMSLLSSRGAEIMVEREYYDFLTKGQLIDVPATRIIDGTNFEADFALSMGGDGTFLKTAHFVGNKGIPVMGINVGRLGFLADVSPTEIEQAIDALFRGDYELEDHAVIQLETDGEPLTICPKALNDIAVLKRDNASMISIRTYINGDQLATYQADGLIVSTPTGSTAYSLSNGGPIIVPQTGVMCLTAVAPHSLNIRPVVIPDDAVITLKVESRSHNFLIAIDGRSQKCSEGTTLTITRAPYAIRIAKRSGRKYYTTLRDKMMWGMDNRS
ncbi:MAG: NAD kinase [Prevotella sp.]|nr:NAD kinase [Prevotella sp.]